MTECAKRGLGSGNGDSRAMRTLGPGATSRANGCCRSYGFGREGDVNEAHCPGGSGVKRESARTVWPRTVRACNAPLPGSARPPRRSAGARNLDLSIPAPDGKRPGCRRLSRIPDRSGDAAPAGQPRPLRVRTCATSPWVEPLAPSAAASPLMTGRNSVASSLPSSTPHWS